MVRQTASEKVVHCPLLLTPNAGGGRLLESGKEVEVEERFMGNPSLALPAEKIFLNLEKMRKYFRIFQAKKIIRNSSIFSSQSQESLA